MPPCNIGQAKRILRKRCSPDIILNFYRLPDARFQKAANRHVMPFRPATLQQNAGLAIHNSTGTDPYSWKPLLPELLAERSEALGYLFQRFLWGSRSAEAVRTHDAAANRTYGAARFPILNFCSEHHAALIQRQTPSRATPCRILRAILAHQSFFQKVRCNSRDGAFREPALARYIRTGKIIVLLQQQQHCRPIRATYLRRSKHPFCSYAKLHHIY